jgi:hypothetical protein
MAQPNGFIAYTGPSQLDGSPIVVVVTGLRGGSANRKTGAMLQTWILRADVSPLEAARTGADVSICGDCPHRGISDGTVNVGRSCYVTLVQGPRSVFAAYQRGIYPAFDASQARAAVAGRTVRLGAYGDPAAVPMDVLRSLTETAARHTGYTHQWQHRQDLQGLCMASVDTAAEALQAKAAGWRLFRVNSGAGDVLPGVREVSCPASEEMGKRTTCERCSLCNGSRGANDKRADITIRAHGAMAVNFYRSRTEAA